ncbi:Zinc finger protein 106 [Eumeta japonica]|uniref:Zinc finger protein 106 n=1 Tax=Eumeta variegata TaxID=151549 RepID=A0A4C1TFB8_EUMVA|nr:Zinc finger protein 106 [Eumeta japonica]
MDKGAIHKLLDNPNSSVKFEYAINSLLTESQNSFNRQTRAAAEKSLNSVNTDHFQYQNEDTIYEDTFLKQMQCILDPTDTILLADIKPMVMAEINKVLQIDEEQRTNLCDDNEIFHTRLLETEMADISDEVVNINENIQTYECDVSSKRNDYVNKPVNIPEESIQSEKCIYGSQILTNREESDFLLKKKIVEGLRKEDKSLQNQSLRRRSTDYNCVRRNSHNSTLDVPANNENVENDNYTAEKAKPLFESHIEIISDEEDPFDELDKQYHVAVDPTFIENDGTGDQRVLSPHRTIDISPFKKSTTHIDYNGYSNVSNIIKSDSEIQNLSNKQENTRTDFNSDPSLIKLENDTMRATNTLQLDKQNNDKIAKSNKGDSFCCKPERINKYHVVKSEKTPEKNSYFSDTSQRINSEKCIIERSSEQKSSRKRSIEQRESHHIDDKDPQKQTKRSNIDETTYSDKYVKRKDTPKKVDNQDDLTTKRRHSSSTLIYHSTQTSEADLHSPDNHMTSKNENKTKLTSIDMFTEQPRKMNLHQALRNTALVDSKLKLPDEKNSYLVVKPKPKAGKDVKQTTPTSTPRKSKETQTLHSMQVTTRFCQTETIKLITTGTQTSNITDRTGLEKHDIYERMKEIDLEIQLLLQERFKLYNSIDAKEASSVMTNFGMTVINMAPFEDTSKEIIAEDIIDNLTNLSEDELEKIALHEVQDTIIDDMSIDERKSLRTRKKKKVPDKGESINKIDKSSSLVKPKKMGKKSVNPNISLLEQIITDDRPLEDIISLEDLESTPTRTTRYRKKKVMKEKTDNDKAPVSNFKLKACSVVLVREDISKYLRVDKEKIPVQEKITPPEQLLQENVNEIDFQYDMLDVSEDIVIDDNCEISETVVDDVTLYNVSYPEEVIDNSQMSQTSLQGDSVQNSTICRIYDFSIDGESRQDVMRITGNADAVLAIESIENNFLAACLDGNVYYYSSDGQLQKTLRGSNLAVTCLSIVEEKYGTTVYTGSLDSRIRYYDLQTGLEKGPECNVLSPIQTMDRAWDTIFVGTRTGFVLQFECKNNMLIPVSTIKFSENSILALRALKEGPRKVLLVAARSENVTIKDAQSGLLLRTLEGPKMTVYTLLYEEGKVFCGTSSHQIQVFDYSSGIHVGEHEGGKGAVCLRACGGLLLAGCYDGCVYVYRSGERSPIAQLRGPAVMLLSLAIVGNKKWACVFASRRVRTGKGKGVGRKLAAGRTAPTVHKVEEKCKGRFIHN